MCSNLTSNMCLLVSPYNQGDWLYGEREIEIESKINRSSGKEDLLGSSWAGQFGPALQSDLTAAGARTPGIDFLENQILLPRASSSLPPSLSRSVPLSSLYGAGWQVRAWGEAVKGRVTRCGRMGMGSTVSAWPPPGLAPPHPGLALFVTWTPAPVCNTSPCCHAGLFQSFPTQPGSQRGLNKTRIPHP